MKKLASLTLFFPFFNDAGTVQEAVEGAYTLGNACAQEIEVICIHGGPSKDGTYEEILKMKKRYPDLVVIDKGKNTEGYAVIKYGFQRATKEWVFYTDGDLQYDLNELPRLIEVQQTTHVDVVNGYKQKRGDRWYRVMAGNLYAIFSRVVFQLPIRDVDCDFRLMRTKLVRKFTLEAQDSSVLPELIVKLKRANAQFQEIPVGHFDRKYGHSNYSLWGLFREKMIGDTKMWFLLRK